MSCERARGETGIGNVSRRLRRRDRRGSQRSPEVNLSRSLAAGREEAGKNRNLFIAVVRDLPVVLPDADAGVGGTEVDTDSGPVNLSHCCCLTLGKLRWGGR